MNTGERFPALDGLRAFAIIGVLIVHANELLDTTQPFERLLHSLSEVGAYGVDLFFVLSGFLISGILIDAKPSRNYFQSFYARRFLRLFPVYYGYLFVLAFILPSVHKLLKTSMPDYRGDWWWYITYLSNWKPGHGSFDINLGHFWSLAVEEQFYLIWPVMIFFVPRKHLSTLFIAILFVAVALRIWMAAHGVWWNTLYRLTPTRMDSLAFGSLLALAVRDPSWRDSLNRIAPATLLASLFLWLGAALAGGDPSWKSLWIQIGGSVFIEIGFSCLILLATMPGENLVKRVGTLDWLRKCGTYSYTIYVLHEVVYFHFLWLLQWFTKRYSLALSLGMKIVFALLMMWIVYFLASLSWRWVESPLLSLKRKFSYDRVPA